VEEEEKKKVEIEKEIMKNKLSTKIREKKHLLSLGIISNDA
jgi:hypothetical protein